ncbi:MAG: UDP-N-acetylmuramoyl-L-alanine--D-glutamate ligase [Myxococcota bacterium]
MSFAGRSVLVVGFGRSGLAAARFLARRGARVTVTDMRTEAELHGAVRALGGAATLELGGHRAESFTSTDLVVLSPGVPPLPEIDAARRAGVEIVGEYELACRQLRGTLVAITGTNGKSTTTSLCGHLCAELGRPLFVGGNLGTPLIEAADGPAAGEDGLVIAEVSSFQLETVRDAHAQVAALLNVTEDHLDRYADMGAYGAAKQRVFLNQTERDLAIVKGGLEAATRASVRRFASDQRADAWLDGADLVIGETRYATSDLPLVGRHNHENALAAFLVARAVGVSQGAIRERAKSFRPLPHRMEPAGEIDGVAFYDDSKATNVGSVVGSLEGFVRPLVLIAGGRDKGGDYAPLVAVLRRRARAVVLIGEARERIAAAIGDALPIVVADDMPAAVRRARTLAQPGDAVVLSPACSSYDMFENFEERGRAFKAAVDALRKEAR